MSASVLLCTLGASWAVIPEVLGFLAPNLLDLYQHHPDQPALADKRQVHDLRAPDELWIVTTPSTRGLDELKKWWQELGEPIPLRLWQATAAGQLLTQAECEAFRELVFRAALHAREKVGSTGHLYMSLAGGRKTMSADLQYAAQFMGCEALLHVVSKEGRLPAALNGTQPEVFCAPLAAELADWLSVIFNGQHHISPLLDLELSDAGPLQARDFALPGVPETLGVQPGYFVSAWASDAACLWRTLDERQRESEQLLENYLAGVQRNELHNNWHGLYRLAPALIRQLRSTRLAVEHAELLQQLPKADLHAHLGGYLDLAGQQAVGRAVWAALSEAEQKAARTQMAELLAQARSGIAWPDDLKAALASTPHSSRSAHAACLWHELTLAELEQQLFPLQLARVGLKDTAGFSAYERPGDLSGSALLTHPAALPAYAREIRLQMERQGLCYLELRGSPHKYVKNSVDFKDGLDFITRFQAALEAEGTRTTEPTVVETSRAELRQVRLIVIADRRQSAQDIRETVALAVKAHEDSGFVVGLDLAGDESDGDLDAIAEAFAPAFKACLPVTIHAGEGQPAEKIWEAAYLLHAERIGHGLTLAQNEALANKFRDRGVCLELCPTSNVEVVGFRVPGRPETAAFDTYPLEELWRKRGLHLTICTDNPGISRTDLVQEYLLAGQMYPDLTLWDVLAMIRRSFVHSFLPYAERARLIKDVDVAVLQLIRTMGLKEKP